MKVNKRHTILLILTVLFFCTSTIHAQNRYDMQGRASELFPYPYKDLKFVIPRFDRQNLVGGNYFNSYVVRSVMTFKTTYHLRMEVPLANTNTSGENVFGLSDINFRFIHTKPIHEQLYWGYGGLLVLPTATDKSLGAGKWQLRPQVGMIYFMGNKDDVKGTIMLGAEYRFSFAGSSSRQKINVAAISPNIDYWAKKWYIGYYATWTYDFENDILDIPLDVEFGYSVSSHVVLSAEYILPLIKKRTYNNEYAFKVKYLF